MAVLKLSKSGKQVQFIADDGTVYIQSLAYLVRFLKGEFKMPILLFSKFPLKASMDRFKESPVYDPGGLVGADTGKDNLATDALSPASRKTRENVKKYEDVLL